MFTGDFDGSPTELIQILGGTYLWIRTPIWTTSWQPTGFFRFLSCFFRLLSSFETLR